jgi:hypothetical protein
MLRPVKVRKIPKYFNYLVGTSALRASLLGIP